MFEFSKLVSSPRINFRILLSKNFPSAIIKRHNYSQKKGKKNRPKKEKLNLMARKQQNKFVQMNDNYISTIARNWERVQIEQSSISNEGKKFIVMSYNILAQDLLETHMHLYKNHNNQDLDWNQRIVRLAAEILAIRPNILCLQEVQQDHLDMILHSLNDLEFNYVYKKKCGEKTDGCAILFDRNQFRLIKSHTVEYYQSEVERLDRPNIALAAKLLLKDNPQSTLLVVTTHLLYNPRREDVRLAQVQVLLAEIDMLSFDGYSICKEPKRIPIILTGDFNFQPYSAPYRLIQGGMLHYNNLTRNKLEHPEDGYNILTDKVFLPQKLGITDNCQHIDLLLSKYKSSSRLSNSDVENSSNSKENIEDIINQHSHKFASGRLTHSLDLTSVYKHKNMDNTDKEASTFQDEWITVDYIFYSKRKYTDKDPVIDKQLKLVSWYLLPSIKECEKIKYIPNTQIGSDHLALAAEFFYPHSKI